MRFLVISDTHGNLTKALEVYKALEGIDAIIHLGDYIKDAEELGEQLNVDVIAVKGNMDGSYDDNDYKILETECGKLYLSHGHMEDVKMKLTNIYYRAMEKDCVAALFGHTHKAVFEDLNGMYLINPGSLSHPADGSKGTYFILETSKEGLKGFIRHHENLALDTASASKVAEAATAQIAGAKAAQIAEAKTVATAEAKPATTTETKTKSTANSKVQGGYLRGLLNYSDRF